jgi:hypothetical protein
VTSRDVIEQKISSLVGTAVREKHQIVVLHCVASSKTGLTVPRMEFAQQIREEHGRENVLVVIDNAQVCVLTALIILTDLVI